jgi:hypothetical protein
VDGGVTLTDHLAACTRESACAKNNARAAFRQAVTGDGALRAAARSRLAVITAGPTPIIDRCHIARTERAALEEVLT